MKRILVLLMSFVLCASIFVGCGKPKPIGPSDDEQQGEYVMPEVNFNDTLEIKVMDKGYGTKFLDEMIKAYKEINPDVTINITSRDPDIANSVNTEIGSGPESNETDIYFGADVDFPTYYESDMIDKFTDVDGKPNKSLLTSLNNFLNYWTPYNSDKKMKDVIDPAIVNMFTIAGNTYALSWAAGACGLVYNSAIFEEANVAVPTTTDELIASIDAFKAYNAAHPDKAEIVPFIWAGGNAAAYWDYVTYTWWSQYEGVDMFQKYWSLHDGDPYAPNKDYLTQQGQLESLKVLKELVKNDTISAPGSLSGNTADIQKNFVKGTKGKRYAMMPCGDWFENEVAVLVGGIDKLKDFKMMKTPKLSAAIEKNGGDASKVGDYAYTLATTHNVFIPSYSKQRDLALDFLSFVFSDEGCKIFTKYTGSFLPVKDLTAIDNDQATINEMTNFQRSQYEIVKATDYIYASYKQSPLRYAGGMGTMADSTTLTHPAKAMFNNDVTADKAWNDLKNYFIGKWDSYMANAGL